MFSDMGESIWFMLFQNEMDPNEVDSYVTPWLGAEIAEVIHPATFLMSILQRFNTGRLLDAIITLEYPSEYVPTIIINGYVHCFRIIYDFHNSRCQLQWDL